MLSRAALFALLVLPSDGLRTPPLTTRRHAVLVSGSLVPALLLPKPAAHADTLEDIAARSNAAAATAKAKNSKSRKESEQVGGIAGSLVNVAFAGAALGAGYLVFGFAGAASEKGISLGAKEERRPLTEAEKRKYSKLSAKEKRELGIKGL